MKGARLVPVRTPLRRRLQCFGMVTLYERHEAILERLVDELKEDARLLYGGLALAREVMVALAEDRR
jgi:hypothetical protein